MGSNCLYSKYMAEKINKTANTIQGNLLKAEKNFKKIFKSIQNIGE